MNNRSTAKNLLAILLSLTLIASCVVVAGVGAATAGASWGSFDGGTVGDDLALSNANGNTMKVSDAQAHSSTQSLLVYTGKSGGSNRPQLLLKDADGNDFKTAAGKKYRIGFWYYVPGAQSATVDQLSLWVGTKGEDKTAFNAGSDSEAGSKKGHLLTLSGTSAGTVSGDAGNQGLTVSVSQRDSWQYVRFTVQDEATADGGYLILGAAVTSQSGKVYTGLEFYLDDISIEAVPEAADDQGWSFESETAGTNFSMNGHPATVTDELSYDGEKALRVVSSDSSGNGRAQLLLRDTNGTPVTVEAGQKYTVSFWYYIQPDNTAISGLNYWLAAADDSTAFNGSSYKKDEHKLAEPNIATAVKGQWTQETVSGLAAYSGTLRLGISPSTNGNAAPFYLDAIVATAEDLPSYGFNSFERNSEGENLSMQKSAVLGATVTGEQHHTGNYALKIVSNSNSGNGRMQMLVRDEQGQTVKLTAGQSYLVSFWYYMPADSDKTAANYWQLNYWLASANESTVFDGASYKKDDYKVYETATPISTVKGEWTQVSCVVPGDQVKEGTLRLGITRNIAPETDPFYIDDISVRALDEALDYGTNNVALFVGGGKGQSPDGAEVTEKSPVYTVDGKKYGAMRFLGQYTTDAEDLSSVVIGGASYKIVKRGLAVDTAANDNTVLDANASLKVEKTAGFDSCWTYDTATRTVKYSVLIARINKDNLNTPLRYRSYMDIQVGDDVVTVYSAIHGSSNNQLTLDAVAKLAKYDNMAELFDAE